MALELIIILDDAATPHVLQATEDDAYIRMCLQKVLHGNGVAAKHAMRMTEAVAGHIQTVNNQTLTMCRTLTECTHDRTIVLRVAIKSVAHISVNPATQKVWFRSGHANVLVINTAYNNLILIEPTGQCVVKSIDFLLLYQVVHRTKRHLYQVFANLYNDSRTRSPDDNLCTVWSAIYGMLCLANAITSQKQLDDFLAWIFDDRKLMMRRFLQHACYTLTRM